MQWIVGHDPTLGNDVMRCSRSRSADWRWESGPRWWRAPSKRGPDLSQGSDRWRGL